MINKSDIKIRTRIIYSYYTYLCKQKRRGVLEYQYTVLALPVNTAIPLGWREVEPVSMILSRRPEPTVHLVKQ